MRPPVGPRPFCSSLGSARHHRTLRILPQIAHAPTTPLPPIGDQQQFSSVAGPPFTCHPSPASGRDISLLATSKYILQEEEPWNKPTSRNIRLPPKVSRLDVGRPEAIPDCLYPPLSVLSGLEAEDETEIESDGLMLREEGVIPFNSLLPEPLSLDVSAQPEASLDSLGVVNKPMTVTPLLSQAVGSDSISTWLVGTKPLQSQSDRAALNSLNTPPHVPQPFTDFTAEMSRPFLGSNRGPTIPPCPNPQTPPLHAISVDSPGKRLDRVCKSEAQDVTSMASNSSRELSDCVRNIDERLARPCDRARLCGTNAPLQANIDLLRRIVPLQRATNTVSVQLSEPLLDLYISTSYSFSLILANYQSGAFPLHTYGLSYTGERTRQIYKILSFQPSGIRDTSSGPSSAIKRLSESIHFTFWRHFVREVNLSQRLNYGMCQGHILSSRSLSSNIK